MAKLDQATKRLQSALDRLEQAVEVSSVSAGESELRKALTAAQKENAALQKLASTVAAKLDSTIDRLKSTLEA